MPVDLLSIELECAQLVVSLKTPSSSMEFAQFALEIKSTTANNVPALMEKC